MKLFKKTFIAALIVAITGVSVVFAATTVLASLGPGTVTRVTSTHKPGWFKYYGYLAIRGNDRDSSGEKFAHSARLRYKRTGKNSLYTLRSGGEDDMSLYDKDVVFKDTILPFQPKTEAYGGIVLVHASNFTPTNIEEPEDEDSFE